MTSVTHDSKAILTIAIVLWFTHSSFSCLGSRLSRQVKRPYQRAKIIRRGKCLDGLEHIDTQCRDFNKYNTTYFPNILKHEDQSQASQDLHVFSPLIRLNCSPDTQLFLCSTMFPQCSHEVSSKVEMVLPCRSLCQTVRDQCETILVKYGFRWPLPFECHLFPTPSRRQCVKERVTIISTDAPKESDVMWSTRELTVVQTSTVSSTDETVDNETNVEITTKSNPVFVCKNTSVQTKPEDVDPNENPETDRERTTECVKGHYNCRHSSGKSYMNGILYCCFYQKQIVHTVTVNSERGHLESSCNCSYPSLKLNDDC